MGPITPISSLAASILALLHSYGMPLDAAQIWLRVGAPHEAVAAALAELHTAKLAEPRPRVSPENWQPVRVA